MDANGTIDSFTVTTAGSGYTTAPSITIWDGAVNQAAPAPATAVATIGILQVDVTSGGAGYDSVPIVTITELVGGADKGAVRHRDGRGPRGRDGRQRRCHGRRLPDAGPQEVRRHAARPWADGREQPRPATSRSAVPDTTTYPGTDYYEIAVVQYRMKFHRSLPATLLRGYVQLTTPDAQRGCRVAITSPLTNANLDPAVAATPIVGLHRRGQPALPRADHRRHQGPAGPHHVPQPAADRHGRQPLPPGRHHADGLGHRPRHDRRSTPTACRCRCWSRTVAPSWTAFATPSAARSPSPSVPTGRATATPRTGPPCTCTAASPRGSATARRTSGSRRPARTRSYPQGVSVSNVPDMPDPGPGAQTFFYTNQQSARLMFYHDHAWGITRLNVYAGEAAGYLVTDAMEQALIGTGGAMAGLGVGTPLVIQDKTFVPEPGQGGPAGSHLGLRPVGRRGQPLGPARLHAGPEPRRPLGHELVRALDVRPLVLAAQHERPVPADRQPLLRPDLRSRTSSCPTAARSSASRRSSRARRTSRSGMEAFNDTPLVNGTVYPTTTVDPKAYRYRILNAANDRFWNLSWYVADPRTGTLSEVALNPAEVAAAQTDPVVSPTPDDRPGARRAPTGSRSAPRAASCPTPVVVPASPTIWITDPTRFDVGNVDHDSLLLAPAERADVIVDFSQFRGKTLILYNDAPAAFPARVPGYDYYTGGPDLSPAGAPTTLPGYGPNTRTIMQVKVSNATPAVAWDRPNTTNDKLGALMTAWAHKADGSGVFESSHGPDHRRPGRLQHRLRHGLRRQRLVQQPQQPEHEVRRLRADLGAGRRAGDRSVQVQVRHPWPRQGRQRRPAGDPARTQGHPRRDELGDLRRVRADDRQHGPRGPGRSRRSPRTSSCTRT